MSQLANRLRARVKAVFPPQAGADQAFFVWGTRYGTTKITFVPGRRSPPRVPVAGSSYGLLGSLSDFSATRTIRLSNGPRLADRRELMYKMY